MKGLKVATPKMCHNWIQKLKIFVRVVFSTGMYSNAKKMLLIIILFLSFFGHSVTVCEAEIYTYVDKDGVMHFINVPVTTNYKKVPSLPTSVPKISTPKESDKPRKPLTKKNTQSNRSAPTFFGTAWPVASGFIVTNHHVVNGMKNITLTCTNGTKFSATVVAGDEAIDLALLRVKKEDSDKLPPALPLSDSGPKMGSKVFIIGYPLKEIMGAKPKLAEGIVSGEYGYKDDARSCQVSVPVQSGNSGSPLLNMNGEVVGVIFGKLSALRMLVRTGDLPQNVNYAIKIPFLKALIESVKQESPTLKELPKGEGTLEILAERIQNSVLLVTAN